ncbi:lytic murein transglycosylase [Patescibacteria group bacterium]|nr:lytic murein transglycosylase [Patescibacteria group bacterium]MBU1922393.1 lytic murein transglycosylase [Patescibacteria group bacterium]
MTNPERLGFFCSSVLIIFLCFWGLHACAGKVFNRHNYKKVPTMAKHDNGLPAPTAPQNAKRKAPAQTSAKGGKCYENPYVTTASAKYGTPAKLLECIRWSETRHGCDGEHGSHSVYHAMLDRPKVNMQAFQEICRNTGKDPLQVRGSKSGAMGPMQYMPVTWRRHGVDGDGDGVTNPFSLADATFTAASHLAKVKDKKGSWRAAVRAYNNSTSYGNKVLACAQIFN